MTASGEWYSYDSSRTGKPFNCADCGKEVPTDGKRWWNKNTKKTICNDCFLKKTPPQESVTSPRKENVPNQPLTTTTPSTTPSTVGFPLVPVRCDVCGDDVPRGREVHHILRGSKSWIVCFYCYQTVRRVRALKVCGLWPFEKKKDIGEEYDLSPEKGG